MRMSVFKLNFRLQIPLGLNPLIEVGIMICILYKLFLRTMSTVTDYMSSEGSKEARRSGMVGSGQSKLR